MSKRSPTAKSTEYMRKMGFLVGTVERWIPGANVRRDLFSFGDILCVDRTRTLLIQVTSASNLSARVKKVFARPELAVWLAGPGREAWVHGWKGDKLTERRIELAAEGWPYVVE